MENGKRSNLCEIFLLRYNIIFWVSSISLPFPFSLSLSLTPLERQKKAHTNNRLVSVCVSVFMHKLRSFRLLISRCIFLCLYMIQGRRFYCGVVFTVKNFCTCIKSECAYVRRTHSQIGFEETAQKHIHRYVRLPSKWQWNQGNGMKAS